LGWGLTGGPHQGRRWLGNCPARTCAERAGRHCGWLGRVPQGRPKMGVGRAREKERGGGKPRLGRVPGGFWLGNKEGEVRDGKKGFFSFLIYFLNACFTNSLNKQNRCMVRHGATTKRFNPRLLVTQDVELILARALKKNKA
jgi:hypothetical protein